MSAVKKRLMISVEDYLEGELHSQIKHEYRDGFVYAMAGARNTHNDVAGNTFGSLYARLRGKKCRAYNSDTKIRIRMPRRIRFYYPDASVVCHRNAGTDSFQDKPVVIAEALSKSTRRIDEGEKKDAYLMIPSLRVYLLIEQEEARVVVHRRKGRGFVQELYEGIKSVIPLPEIDTELPLAEVYEDVEFTPEPYDEEDYLR
jgi:Uma2 family endonuclease